MIVSGESPFLPMNPSFLNFLRKKSTRERVMPTIFPRVSPKILGHHADRLVALSVAGYANSSVLASRFSLELNS